MVEVIVLVEGQTEEQFIKRLVAPALRHLQIFVKPQLLNTSKDSKGGAISFDRLKFNARNTLRSKPNAILSTLIDLYALDTNFPEFYDAQKMADVYSKVNCLEKAMHRVLSEQIGYRDERFLPYIQPYEFEGLLFSDVTAFADVEPSWSTFVTDMNKIRNAFISPEHINDSYETKPSKRLEKLLQPKYRKTRHGPLVTERISLAVIERECVHFHGWMNGLRGLVAS
jgi:hypothetical protein